MKGNKRLKHLSLWQTRGRHNLHNNFEDDESKDVGNLKASALVTRSTFSSHMCS